jgi:threonine synthase
LDYAAIQESFSPKQIWSSEEASLWRYLPLLPVDDPGGLETPLHAAGWTPVFSPPLLLAESGLRSLWIKDESRNPTASFKDRASAVVIARAAEIKADIVVTASTGNAWSCAGRNGGCGWPKGHHIRPKTAHRQDRSIVDIWRQRLVGGWKLRSGLDLSLQAAHEFGWYCRNTGYNPLRWRAKRRLRLRSGSQLSAAEDLIVLL